MKFAPLLRQSILSVLLLLVLAAPGARGDRFSWEDGTSGNFTDPNRWHGPDFPAHTRFPGAGDDATILRGALTVTIAGDQATRELAVDQPTLNITGSYKVSSLFGFGSPLTINGGGTLNVTLWQLGAQSFVDGAKAEITTLQPFSSSPASELVIRNGAEVTSQALDKTRGALKVVVDGAGAVWKHTEELPFVELVIKANGLVEVPSIDGVFVNAEGGGALLKVRERFSGSGRIANGAVVQCNEGVRAFTGGFMTIDGGTWVVLNTFINDAGDMTILNGGALTAKNVQPGEFSAVAIVEGAGSRMTIANLLSPSGIIQLKRGGSLTSSSAELDKGGIYAETGGAFTVEGNISCNNGLNLVNGGLLTANAVFIADAIDRSGLLTVKGEGSIAELSSRLIVGQLGEGQFTLGEGGRLRAQSMEAGAEPNSLGRVSASGKSNVELTKDLTIGVKGRGELTMSDGVKIRSGDPVSGPPPPPTSSPENEPDCVDASSGAGAGPKVVIGAQAGSNGQASLRGPGTELEVNGDLIVGNQGALGNPAIGLLRISDGGLVSAHGQYVTLGALHSKGTLILEGPGSRIEGGATIEIGRHGDGTLRLLAGARNSAPSTILGCLTDSSGTLEVIGKSSDGQPSTYESRGSITVGSRTRGVVEISNGGQVNSFRRVVLGRFGGAKGTVRLAGADSRWIHTSAAGQQTPGEVIIGEGGYGEFSLLDKARFEAGEMVIGKQGTSTNELAEGRLTINSGASVVARGAFVTIGQEVFSKGTLIIDGADSKLEGIKTSNNGGGATLEIGRHGDGTLILTNGAFLSQPSVILGSLARSRGIVKVEREAIFESDGSITVGGSSTGIVEVAAGGRMISSKDAVIGRSEGSQGTIKLSGADARWQHTQGDGDDSPGELVVGESGRGELEIIKGAQFQASSLLLGKKDKGLGEVTVRNPGSRMLLGSLLIGRDPSETDPSVLFGAGNLTITESGLVEIQPSEESPVVEVISPPGKSSILAVGLGGRFIAKKSALELGGEGETQMTVLEGSEIDTASAIIGAGKGRAIVKLTGANQAFSVWVLEGQNEVKDRLVVGGKGEGKLQIEGLAQVSLAHVILPLATPGVRIGTDGNGSVEIDGKGMKQGDRGAKLDALDAALDLGSSQATGELTISGGGEVRAGDVRLNGPSGTILTVTDENSKLTSSKSIKVLSRSTLTVDGKGHVAAKETLQVLDASVSVLGEGTFDVGPVAATAGSHTEVLGVPGALRIFSTSGPVGEPSGIDVVVVDHGALAVSKVLWLFSQLVLKKEPPYIDKATFVTVKLIEGRITVGAASPAAAPNTVLVNAGGLVTGLGQILGPGGKTHVLVFRNGGQCDLVPYSLATYIRDLRTSSGVTVPNTIRAEEATAKPVAKSTTSIKKVSALPQNLENIPGTLFIDGDYEQTSEGTLNVVVAGPQPLVDYGVLAVTGSIRIAGKAIVNFTGGFAPRRGQTFDFLTSSSTPTGEFAAVQITGLAPGFQYEVQRTAAGTLSLNALNDGVATSSPLLSIESALDQLIISWPATALGFSLESTTNLASPEWQTVPTAANRVTLRPEVPMQYFRLRQ